MVFSQKAKCAGCAALDTKIVKGDREIMYCRLGVEMNFIPAGKKAIQPRPQEPCYKPLNEEEVGKARVLMLQREEKESGKKKKRYLKAPKRRAKRSKAHKAVVILKTIQFLRGI